MSEKEERPNWNKNVADIIGRMELRKSGPLFLEGAALLGVLGVCFGVAWYLKFRKSTSYPLHDKLFSLPKIFRRH